MPTRIESFTPCTAPTAPYCKVCITFYNSIHWQIRSHTSIGPWWITLGGFWNGFRGMVRHFINVSLLPHHPNVHWYMGTTIHSTCLDRKHQDQSWYFSWKEMCWGGQGPSHTVVLRHLFSMVFWVSSDWWGQKCCDGLRDGKTLSNVTAFHCPTTSLAWLTAPLGTCTCMDIFSQNSAGAHLKSA